MTNDFTWHKHIQGFIKQNWSAALLAILASYWSCGWVLDISAHDLLRESILTCLWGASSCTTILPRPCWIPCAGRCGPSPYRADLSLCDFHEFGIFQKVLKGCRSHKDIDAVVVQQFNHPRDFFAEGMYRLVHQCNAWPQCPVSSPLPKTFSKQVSFEQASYMDICWHTDVL